MQKVDIYELNKLILESKRNAYILLSNHISDNEKLFKEIKRFCDLRVIQFLYTKYESLEKAYLNELYETQYKSLSNFKQRSKRLNNAIKGILENNDNVYFITLTFKPKVLSNTSQATRKRYITRFLASISEKYIANIDFGKKNKREHYHAVVVQPNLDLKWSYGFFKNELVETKCDYLALSRYVNKLTNHALKIKNFRIIYSR